MKTDLERQHVALSVSGVAAVVLAVAAVILSTSVGRCSEPPVGEAGARHVTYDCGFDRDVDLDYDLWPDDWTRVRDRKYPSYVVARIQPEHGSQRLGDPAPDDNRVLRILFDGSNASLTSPYISVRRFQTYELSLRVRASNAAERTLSVALSFYDANRRSLGRQRSVLYPQPTSEWRTLALPDVEIEDSQTRYVRVHLTTDSLERFSSGGSIEFDDIRLTEFPQVKLQADRVPHLYGPGERPVLTCAVSADRPRIHWADFELYDRHGELVVEETVSLREERTFGAAHADETHPPEKEDHDAGPHGHDAGEHPATESDAHQDDGRAHSGSLDHAGEPVASTMERAIATWSPELPGPGYYEAVVRCRSDDRDPSLPDGVPNVTFERRLRLVSFPRIEPTRGGSFGWSFGSVDQPLPPRVMAQLAPQLGVQWIRLPVWYDYEDQAAENQMADFLERLSEQGVQFIGALDRPPERFCVNFAADEGIPIARAISDPLIWQPALSPILPRMALKVQRWQLGDDDDTSLIGFPDRRRAIAEVRAELVRYNRQVQIGVPWNWLYELPPDVAEELEFVSFRSDPPLAAHELDYHLEATAQEKFATIVQVRPLPADQYSDDVRARDLLERMIQTRRHETLAALLPDPFDSRRGIFTESGEPMPILLPWRTAASQLGVSRRIGALSLRSEAENHVFLRENDALLVAWSDQPTEETLYLGDRPSAVDLWGNPVPLDQVGDEHIVPIGPTPIFVSGLHPQVAAWRANFRLVQRDLESVPKKPQKLAWEAKNPFAQGATGSVRVDAPGLFDGAAFTPSFRMAPGESSRGDLTFSLGLQANGGMQTIRIDFDVTADRQYRFSTYEKIYVGLKDIRIDIRSAIDGTGALAVEQEFVNLGTTPVNFDFYLYAPDRKRKRLQLRDAGPGTYKLEYIYPNGEELIGKELWLRAEAADGLQALNHRFRPQRSEN